MQRSEQQGMSSKAEECMSIDAVLDHSRTMHYVVGTFREPAYMLREDLRYANASRIEQYIRTTPS